MAERDNRKSIRIDKNKSLKIRPSGLDNADGLLVSLVSVNVSKNGILFESKQAYDVGATFVLRFNGNDNKLYDAQIRIVRVLEIVTRTQYHIGAEFIDPDRDKIHLLVE